jgi:hypothetical protein
MVSRSSCIPAVCISNAGQSSIFAIYNNATCHASEDSSAPALLRATSDIPASFVQKEMNTGVTGVTVVTGVTFGINQPRARSAGLVRRKATSAAFPMGNCTGCGSECSGFLLIRLNPQSNFNNAYRRFLRHTIDQFVRAAAVILVPAEQERWKQAHKIAKKQELAFTGLA